MSRDEVFVDTNVFVYGLDHEFPEKRTRAHELTRQHRGRVVVSTQVLIELHNACTQKLKLGRKGAAEAVATVARNRVVNADRDLVLAASRLADSAQLRIFDAMILVAAKRAGCRTVLSEDLSEGQDYDGVVVENPFRSPIPGQG